MIRPVGREGQEHPADDPGAERVGYAQIERGDDHAQLVGGRGGGERAAHRTVRQHAHERREHDERAGHVDEHLDRVRPHRRLHASLFGVDDHRGREHEDAVDLRHSNGDGDDERGRVESHPVSDGAVDEKDAAATLRTAEPKRFLRSSYDVNTRPLKYAGIKIAAMSIRPST